MRTVVFVLFDDVQSLDVTGPMEVFAGGNVWCRHHRDRPAYDIRTASLGGTPVRTSSGLALTPSDDLRALSRFGTLVVPGGPGSRVVPGELVDWLRGNGRRARRLVSVCTGAFLLAEAGLLAGVRATTHWSRCAELSRRFPDIEVDADPIYVRSGSVITSAGVTTGIDLALALVEADLGRDAALAIARHLVVFLRRPGNQSQFSAQLSTQVAAREPLRDLQQWIVEHPADDLSVPALAARVNLSERQFARVFAAEIGMNPGRYVERVRTEAARRALEDSSAGVESIARDCGFGTAEAMRRGFIRSLGVNPTEYRRRFQPPLKENHADRHPLV